MSKQRILVSWSPHNSSLFAVGGESIRIFETDTISSNTAHPISDKRAYSPPISSQGQCNLGTQSLKTDLQSNDALTSEKTEISVTTQRKRSFRLLKFHAQVPHLKCMEWYPFADKSMLIAAGSNAGKIVLCDFEGPQVEIMRELSPRYTRPCSAIAWNPAIPHQIAAGFDKVRGDHCTLVWDFEQRAESIAKLGLNCATNRSSSTLSSSILARACEGPSNAPLAASGPIGGKKIATGSLNGSTTKNKLNDSISGSFVFDDGSKPRYELANSEATVAVSWVPLQPKLLATGTGFRWLRIYDLRMQSNAAPLSVVAHTKAVFGLCFDPHRPHLLATYSDGMQESVKIWDIRRLEASCSPMITLQTSSKSITQIAWCPTRAGILVSSSSDEKYLSFWDIGSACPEKPNDAEAFSDEIQYLKKPFKRRYTCEPIVSFSWRKDQCSSHGMDNVLAAAFPDRILTASTSREIDNCSVHDSMPIAISPYGVLAFSCGQISFSGSISEPNPKPTSSHDISEEMYYLAKQGYSMTISRNLQILKTEMDNARSISTSRQYFRSCRERYQELGNVWNWISQIEFLRRSQLAKLTQTRDGNAKVMTQNSSLHNWPINPNLLAFAGVRTLLSLKTEALVFDEDNLRSGFLNRHMVISETHVDSELGCQCYEGFGRKLALLACQWDVKLAEGVELPDLSRPSQNWTSTFGEDFALNAASYMGEWPQYDLQHVLSVCESEGDYCRAAAIAAFHGNLRSTVAILQKAGMQCQAKSDTRPTYSNDIYQLVAMAVAGYSKRSSMENKLSMEGSLWINMCEQLLKRNEICSPIRPRYLHALLSFLCACYKGADRKDLVKSTAKTMGPTLHHRRRSWGSIEGLFSSTERFSWEENTESTISPFISILNDTTLKLSDRIAFACRYLPADELCAFIRYIETQYTQNGYLEGLIVTGLDAKGLELLQTYLDATADIQTVALIAARLFTSQNKPQRSSLKQWISEYQDLLNNWQLFYQRARFDVVRSQMDSFMNEITAMMQDGSKEHEEMSTSLASVPPHLYVRCNYCNASLSLASLLRLGGSQSSWLNRAKPKLACCPSCRKPLPRCSLCLLPFGCLNPYFELARRRSKQLADNVHTVVSHSLAASQTQDVAPPNTTVASEAEVCAKIGENMAQLSSIPFVEWFTWCQTCKHGGHAHHLADWFEKHTVCPVTDCNCLCKALDEPLIAPQSSSIRRISHDQSLGKVVNQTSSSFNSFNKKALQSTSDTFRGTREGGKIASTNDATTYQTRMHRIQSHPANSNPPSLGDQSLHQKST